MVTKSEIKLLKQKIKNKIAEQKIKCKKCKGEVKFTPPRYDDAYWDAMEILNSNPDY
jgi:hypothetical protein